jgi:hypothetical protein
MPKDDDLEARKALVSKKYLGKGGIHGVGMARSKSAVKVYVDPAASAGLDNLLEAIRKEVTPFRLLVIREDRASTRD